MLMFQLDIDALVILTLGYFISSTATEDDSLNY